MPMDAVDRTEYGLYMQVVRERAARRIRKGKKHPEAAAPAADGAGGGNVVYLRRGFIDDVW